MVDDLEPSATCAVLLQLEDKQERPPPGEPQFSQQQPHCTPVQQQDSQQTVAPGQSSQSPPKKWAWTVPECRAPDDSALLKIIEVSTRQMTNVCKRQHVDVTGPTLAFAIHLCHELQSLPADLQSDAKLELHKVVNQFHKKGWSLLSH